MISSALLDILVCPETKQSLSLLGEDILLKINQQIDAGQIFSRCGTKLDKQLSGALLREDGEYAYQILDDIPVMLVDEAFRPPS